jgi:multiple sugar transport system ATP-binding protein
MAQVGLQHVTRRYGDVAVVRDLTLEVRDREFMVLLGPSGCGKTTTLRLVAGLEPVSEGRILIGERVVNDLPPHRRDVAMVFQSAGGLMPNLDVHRNLAFPLVMHRASRTEIDQRVGVAGRRLGLERLLGRPLPQLSFGHRQQVALGRVMVRRPPSVFLLDQPLGNLDAKVRAERRLDLRRLHRELGATVICATHDQVEAMTLGERIAIMRDGELQQVGTPRGVYEHPANLYVAGFVGSPRMNLVPVVLADRAARASSFSVELPRALGVERAVLGIRPEALSERVRDGATVVEVTARLIEMVGPHQLVHGRAGADTIVARVARSFRVFRGDRVRLAVDPDRLHVFDAATGRALL